MQEAVKKYARKFAAAAAIFALATQVTPAGAQGANDGALAYAAQAKALYRSDGPSLYRSNDDGKSWAQVPLGSRSGAIRAVVASPTGDEALYVAGPGLGVLKSVDGGASWRPIDDTLPSRDVTTLAAHNTEPDTLYAVLAGAGIYRTEDGGNRWRLVDKGPSSPIRQLIHSNMEGSMQSGWLFAATDQGVHRAMDCLCGFRVAGNSPEVVPTVVHDPAKPEVLYAASAQQVFRTANGGEEWQLTGSPGAAISALAHSPSGVLYALLADGRVMRSDSQGARWE